MMYCHICGLSIPRAHEDLKYDTVHPLYPNRDHVIPRARGGSDHSSNIRWAHRFCNVSKGADSYWRSPVQAQKWLGWRLTNWDALDEGKAVLYLPRLSDRPVELWNVPGLDRPYEFIKVRQYPSVGGYRLVIRKDEEGRKYFNHYSYAKFDPAEMALERYEQDIVSCDASHRLSQGYSG